MPRSDVLSGLQPHFRVDLTCAQVWATSSSSIFYLLHSNFLLFIFSQRNTFNLVGSKVDLKGKNNKKTIATLGGKKLQPIIHCGQRDTTKKKNLCGQGVHNRKKMCGLKYKTFQSFLTWLQPLDHCHVAPPPKNKIPEPV